ncbi:MAG TPA: hypothetical protein VK894_01230 [Jiangellales bacterium]|nr:hypothetical protein [Jiangellales bacterium]
MRTHRRRAALAGLAVAVALLVGMTGPAVAAPDFTGNATGQELTARWWQVALFGADLSFFDDSLDGGNCRQVDLPSGPVVLVAGTFGGASGPRACEIPVGATLVLPVVNSIWALTDPGDSVGDAQKFFREYFADAAATATVDGDDARVRRIKSSRFLVDATAFAEYGPLVAVSDGYWLVVRLDPGVHTVTTTGSASGFDSATTYTFTVG